MTEPALPNLIETGIRYSTMQQKELEFGHTHARLTSENITFCGLIVATQYIKWNRRTSGLRLGNVTCERCTASRYYRILTRSIPQREKIQQLLTAELQDAITHVVLSEYYTGMCV